MKHIYQLLLLLALGSTAHAQTIVYVDSAASGSNNGSSWANAYTRLSSAFTLLSTNPSTTYELKIAKGSYYPAGTAANNGTYKDSAFTILRGGLKLYGGYNASTGIRNITANPVYLDGTSNSYHVMLIASLTASADSVVLDGLTIRNGKANGTGTKTYSGQTISRNRAGGLYLVSVANGGKTAIRNTTISGNDATYAGAGMYNSISSPVITNVTISGNTTTYGGGMSNSSSSPVLTNVTIKENIASLDGGGMYNESSSSPVLTGGSIDSNRARNGGGMSNESSSPELSNVSISGNTANYYGGGMYNSSSSPILNNVSISDNTATHDGGGMYNVSSSSPVLTGGSISGNWANSTGGGMYNLRSSPLLTNVSISGNSGISYGGGGMYNFSSSPVLTNVRISGNNTNYSGGGICNDYSSSPVLTHVTITGNRANAGGGIYNYEHSSPLLTNMSIDSNWATTGGGMHNEYYSSPVLTNVTISGDTAFLAGGMYNYDWSSPVLVNVSISGNRARFGGGMYNSSSSYPQIKNTIIWGNTATSTVGISGSSTPVISNSCIEQSSVPSGTGNINTNPLFVNPGNPVGTDGIFGTADDGLKLQSGSPAINTGSNAAITAGNTIDITGAPRIQRITVDMGAYESPYFTCGTSTVVYVDSASGNDFTKGGTSWADAYKTLSMAMATAQQCRGIDSILIAKGTYYPAGNAANNATNKDSSFAILRGGLKLYGGYNASTGIRNITANPVVLDGTGNSYHVMLIAGLATSADSVVLDGFNVKNGNANGSGTKTYQGQSINRNSGGGLCLVSVANGGKTAIRNMTISGNTVSGSGGGMLNITSSPLLTNVSISDNTATNVGGGMYNSSSSPVLTNVTMSGNVASTNGGGMYNSFSPSSVLTNVTISGNTANTGGGMYNLSSSPQIKNTIIWGNAATNTVGIYNNISTPTISYSCIEQSSVPSGTGNINTHPFFVDPANPAGADGIFRSADDGLKLLVISPAINAGSNAAIPAGITTDITSAARIQRSKVDMGAYEGENCPENNVLYVDSNLAAGGNGSNWANAFTTLNQALELAGSCSGIDSILIAKGTYYPAGTAANNASYRDSAFTILRGGLKLYGGYNASTGIRNITANPVYLDGTSSSYHVLLIAGLGATADSVVLDGFTIRNGKADGSGTKTYNGQTANQYHAGGLYLLSVANGGKTAFRNLSISGNISFSAAGGMCNYFSSPVLINMSISGNMASLGAGGMYNTSSSPVLTNVTITGNSGGNGGGMYNFSSSPILTNVTISGNTAFTGGGMYNFSSSSPQISNTIIWGNTATNTVGVYNSGASPTPVISYSCIEQSSVPSGTGNINTNPLFVTPGTPAGTDGILGTADDGLTLQIGSPAINTGNSADIPPGITSDITGSERIQSGRVDMGAYESPYLACGTTTVVYVDSTSGNDITNGGTSWADAYKTLSKAMAAAQQCSGIDSILIAKGTYYPAGTAANNATYQDSAFTILRGGLKLYGGYNASTGIRNITANPVYLDGAINSYHVVLIVGLGATADSVVLDGFTIRNGKASGSSTKTYNGQTAFRTNGGGIYLLSVANGGKTTMRNITISGNRATYGGGGMYNRTSSPALINVSISGNMAGSVAGGMYNSSSSPVLTNVTISGNTGSSGGGIFNDSSSPELTNVTISNNSASSSGGGIYNIYSSTQIKNTIIWGNSATFTVGVYNNNSTTTIHHSCIEQSSVPSGTGNINTNPLFVNPGTPAGTDGIFGTADDGLQLQACSPAINEGDATGIATSTDITGNLRIYNTGIDMGAYEYQGLPDGSSLANSGDTATQNIYPGINGFVVSNACRVIARVAPNGSSPLDTSVTATVTIDASVQSYSGQYYVQRHYDITPVNNAANATAKVTLFFTQGEFNTFNDSSSVALPTSGTDLSGIANLRVTQYHGTSATGLPGSYSGSTVLINPADNDIVWNSSLARWEVSFDVTGFSGFTLTASNNPLPLTLLSFSGVLSYGQPQLQWKTASEIHLSHFELQRSYDAQTYTNIATIAAQNGNNQTYNYDDVVSITGSIFYRLKMVDLDGQFTYSNVVVFKKADDGMAKMMLYPNPVQDFATVSTNFSGNADIIDATGRMMLQVKLNSGTTIINLASLPAGAYFIKAINGELQKFVKH